MEKTIEVCCGSYYDCLQAERGGAKRVELNSALHLGGLTPSVGSLVLTKQNTKLHVIAMVRPRAAGFHYQEEDFQTMLLDIESLLEHGADGIAFGCLDAKGNIQVEQTKTIIDKIHEKGKEAVFHRAFDCVNDPFTAIETLISLGADRILTSGLEAKAIQALPLLKRLQDTYGQRIELLAGSGMNASNAKELMDATGISQVHSSCKGWKQDPTTVKNNVSYAFADGDHEQQYDAVDAQLVRRLVDAVK